VGKEKKDYGQHSEEVIELLSGKYFNANRASSKKRTKRERNASERRGLGMIKKQGSGFGV